MRADALQNRQRVLDAANTMFREHGIEVTVGEIADAAGVGRGTLFRNFPTKDHLIAAVLSERILDAVRVGRTLLQSEGNDAEKIFSAVAELVREQNANRALFEGVSSGEFLAYPEMHAAHDEFMKLLEEFVALGQRAGSVRPEITAMDVIMLMKGICTAPGIQASDDPDVILRHTDLICAAISTPAYSRPLRGTPPTLPV
ncbi:MAG TPA: TetR/AcrR family transcriptional regulator [Solirubrobacteraceae bacterium]|nr:TetR/AcrR family transcriptional regulator [Solirubrobacteraceae bacterium]